MPEPALEIRRILTSRQERKELLALACEVDRAAWRQACRPSRSPGARFAHDLLDGLESFSAFIPGRIGRWLRGASFLSSLGRQFGWLRL